MHSKALGWLIKRQLAMSAKCNTSFCFQIIYMVLAATFGLPRVGHREPCGKAGLPYSHLGYQRRSGFILQDHKLYYWTIACLCMLNAEMTPSRDTPIAKSTTWLQCC